jgi:phage terminase large subunit-like protein
MDNRTGIRNSAKLALVDTAPDWTRWRTKSPAARAIRFAETYLIVPKGHGAGKPMKLATFQKNMLEELLDDASLRSAIVSMPRGQGKSTLSAALALWALHDNEHSPQVPVIATTLQQAIRTVYDTCRRMTEVSPALAERTISYSAIGATRLFVPRTSGVLYPLPADPDGLQGLDPSFAIVDEVGFVDQDLWDAMVLASGKRPRSMVLGIGTPNVERRGAMFELRERSMEGAELSGFRYIEFAADQGCELRDRDQWRKANPAIGAGFLAEDALEMAVDTSPEASFRVYRLGQWELAGENWLPIGAFDACRRPGVGLRTDGEPVFIGLDVALKHDTTAVVAVQRQGDEFVAVATVFDPKGSTVDIGQIEDHLRVMHQTYPVQEVAYDPAYFERSAQALLDEGLPLVEFAQSAPKMVPACGHAYEVIATGQLVHDFGDQATEQVLSAQPKVAGEGWRLSKGRTKRKIDTAIALVMALDRATTVEPQPQLAPVFAW